MTKVLKTMNWRHSTKFSRISMQQCVKKRGRLYEHGSLQGYKYSTLETESKKVWSKFLKVKLGYCDNIIKSSSRKSLGSMTNTELNELWKSKRLWSTSPGTNGWVAPDSIFWPRASRWRFPCRLGRKQTLDSLRTRLKHATLDCLQSPGSWNPVSLKTCQGRWLTSHFF